MHKRFFKVTVAFVAALSLPQFSFGEHHEEHEPGAHHEEHQSAERHGMQHKSVENLSPALRALLAKEMQALQRGMLAAIPAFVSGNLAEVEEIGRSMKNSYILKQSLTREQMHELHSKLPAGFIKMDQEFHYFAGMLAHAANRRKLELVNFYFSKLTESCVSCHSEYATHKFPGLSAKGAEGGGDHHDH